nr:PEPxxWA-CTERM sorting domain-containing protein [Sphingomonas laterariae]
MRLSLAFLACAYFGFSAVPAFAATCGSVSFGGDFAGSYSCSSLGTPTGVTGQLGGVTFLDNNTLLIGGNANTAQGYIASIDVVRGADGHITGFGAPSAFYAAAPQIDGGLTFGPGGVLFATGYPTNTLLQYKPGSTAPDKIISLGGAGGVGGTVGTLQFVPQGFDGAGNLKIASYSTGQFYTATLTADGSGLYTVGAVTLSGQLSGGPEGLVYVDGGNAGFGVDSLLVSEYSAGKVGTYTLDANGNPIAGTRRDFITGLNGAEGAVIDPLTGDFLFSTFGSGNGLFVISGFTAPPAAVPEPATWAMMIAGFGLVGGTLRRRHGTLATA